ncbi:bacillithiol biosynthesis cysteine-adding enzyme BshC [Arcticibacterium luteifluviistationis]|uniref:Putative cysteine ligase BshC n=1 Tax=Arcticibacterium luteifluviistationis TaxID=1784714 RepID=A0A2Z4GFX9_9BACT|nr:bacillithiol biosynthesis cysteine-adding enzyme BshC [Arcticibacterium luteifluviistationis]AWV99967.1 bacillithiol biosynthesis cysteine-adding enzyme BshC [Arcticibacterium luteifluviistationis]
MEPGCQKLPLEKIGAFSQLFLDYINKSDSLKPFYNQYPEIENFKKLIEEKSFSSEKRQTLVAELHKQYAHLDSKPDIDILLSDKTFAVTTGHQLNIFTGPLYIIFKIVTVINLAKKLKEAYPEYNFVPVYWMATEDHDLEEIQVCRAFGEKRKWTTPQMGAVGRMTTEGLPQLAAQLGKGADFFKNAYQNNDNLADAVRDYMHHLFGQYDLITLDADSRALKSQFASVMEDDILNNTSFDLVNTRTSEIEALGYKTQITPREINFFYLEDGLRERIVKTETGFEVLNTEITFSEEEILSIIENEPEKISPNVVLRPLYEEWILPNLAYIGGPSEVPYWLQLKPVFDFYKEAFPTLMPRNFGLLLDERSAQNLEKLNLNLEDIFKATDTLKAQHVKSESEKELDLQAELESLQKLYAAILKKADKIDITLSRTTKAFETKSVDLLERLEKKLLRAEKRNYSEALSKIEKLREHLCPAGGLQERKDNMLNFYGEGNDLIEKLIATFDPLEYQFNVVSI